METKHILLGLGGLGLLYLLTKVKAEGEVTVEERQALLDRCEVLRAAGIITYSERYALMLRIARATRDEFNDIIVEIEALEESL